MVPTQVSRRAISSLSQLWPAAQEAGRAISTSAGAAAAPAAPAAPAAAPPPPPPPPSDLIEVFVNDQPVKIPKTFTVLQACDAAGIDIPR